MIGMERQLPPQNQFAEYLDEVLQCLVERHRVVTRSARTMLRASTFWREAQGFPTAVMNRYTPERVADIVMREHRERAVH